jgi:uncharacterized repeat protein (TIGR04076 family)
MIPPFKQAGKRSLYGCPRMSRVGEVKDTEVVGRICMDALCSMAAKVYALRYNADLPWLPNLESPARHACPDAANPVVYELPRIPKQ